MPGENGSHPRIDFIMPHGYQLNDDGSPGIPMLERLSLAERAFRTGEFRYILLSGKHGSGNRESYRRTGISEADFMRGYFLSRGISPGMLIGSGEGTNTWECLSYARDSIIVPRGFASGIMVSNSEHLPRIEQQCKKLFRGFPISLSYMGVECSDRALHESMLEHERLSMEYSLARIG